MLIWEIRKRGSNSYLIVVSRGYDYEGNRLKSVQKTVKPPKEYTPKQAEKWVKEQAILFEREVQHTPEPINRSITLAKYIEHWAADIGPKKLADSTYQRDLQDIRRILPTLGNYKLTDLRKEVIRDFYEQMRHAPRLDGRGTLSEKSVEGLHNTLCGLLSCRRLWTRDTLLTILHGGATSPKDKRKSARLPMRKLSRS